MLVVSDTSPITALLQIGRADLLPLLFRRVVIPPAVQDELSHEHSSLPAWLEVRTPVSIPSLVRDANLDPGETQAIALALELHADTVLMDERMGRRVAVAVGLYPTGVLGCFVLAKRLNHISSVRQVISELQTVAGCWFDKALVEAVLRAAGEE